MQPARLLKLMLLMLSIAIVSRPCFATDFGGYSGRPGTTDFASFSKRPREKYDDRHSLAVHRQTPVADCPFPALPDNVMVLSQKALEAKLTARHLLNIHFRIIPERRLFLRLRSITV